MIVWTDARMVKLMEFMIKDDDEEFKGDSSHPTWKDFRKNIGRLAGGDKAMYKAVYKHWCAVDPSITIEPEHPCVLYTHAGDDLQAAYSTMNAKVGSAASELTCT